MDHVFITGRRKDVLDAAVADIGCRKATAVQGDVANLGDLDRLYDAVGKLNRKIDVIFANAGLGRLADFGTVDEEFFDLHFDANVKGLFFTVQKGLPFINDGGSIILNASIASIRGFPAMSVYCATKAAVRSFARTWTNDLRQRRIRGAATDRGDAIAGLPRELDAEVAKPADPLDGDKVARQRAAMTQSIECSNSGAQQRRGLGSIKGFGDASQRLDRRDHKLLIAPVVTDSGNLRIRAINKIASPARGTSAVLAAMPADPHPFALPPVLYTSPDRVDDPNHFVSGHARVRYPGKNAFLRGYIAVTDSTRLDANPDLCRARLPDFTFDDFEVRTRLRYLHHFHLCHVPFLPLLRQWQTTLTRRHGLKFRLAGSCILDYLGHFVRLRQHHDVAGRKDSRCRVHLLRHALLLLGRDHLVVAGDDVLGRPVMPWFLL